jgi:hypothetical protein
MIINSRQMPQLNQIISEITINQGLTARIQKSFAQSYPQASFLKQAF